jgi:hypothetical protein
MGMKVYLIALPWGGSDSAKPNHTVSSKYPLKNVEISEKIGEMMSLQKDTKTGSGENLTNGKKHEGDPSRPTWIIIFGEFYYEDGLLPFPLSFFIFCDKLDAVRVNAQFVSSKFHRITNKIS